MRPLGGCFLAKCGGQVADLGFRVAAVTPQGLQEGQLALHGEHLRRAEVWPAPCPPPARAFVAARLSFWVSETVQALEDETPPCMLVASSRAGG